MLEGQDKFAPTTERRAGGVGGVDSIERSSDVLPAIAATLALRRDGLKQMLPADYANAFAALRDPFWRRESESRVYRDESKWYPRAGCVDL